MIDNELLKKLPNCIIHSTIKQEDDEDGWLKARTSGIGGSDIGAICGVSPFSTPRQIYLRKTGQYLDPVEEGSAACERMHFGHMLEPIVANEFARRNNVDLIEVGGSLAHKDYPYLVANVDRLIVDKEGNITGILECKTTSEYMKDEWESGEVLPSYYYQLQHYLYILDLQVGYFACLCGGNKYYQYQVIRDDELINTVLLPTAKTFWYDNVLALKQPALHQLDTDFIDNKYSESDSEAEVVFTDDATNELVRNVSECSRKIKELEKIQGASKNALKERMQEKEIGFTKDFVVTWKKQTSRRLNSKMLQNKYPDIYKECLQESSSRVMRIKGSVD